MKLIKHIAISPKFRYFYVIYFCGLKKLEEVSLTFIFFAVLSVLAIASAVVTITNRHPVTSAIALVFHFFMLAGLYLTLQAQFAAVMQVLVYAGAIMVLVIFVIMLLNLTNEDKLKVKYNYRLLLGAILSGAFIILLGKVFFGQEPGMKQLSQNSEIAGTVDSIGKLLYTEYLLPFEAVSILLLTAVVGAVMIAKRKLN